MPAFLFTGTQANVFSNTANRLIPLEFIFLPATSFSFPSAFCITSKYQGQVLPQLCQALGRAEAVPQVTDTFVVKAARRMGCLVTSACVSHWGQQWHLWGHLHSPLTVHVGPCEFLTCCPCHLPKHGFTAVEALVNAKYTWNLVLGPNLMHSQPWSRLITS